MHGVSQTFDPAYATEWLNTQNIGIIPIKLLTYHFRSQKLSTCFRKNSISKSGVFWVDKM